MREINNDLIDVGIALLESRKEMCADFVRCLGCEQEICKGSILICNDCLEDECEYFYVKAKERIIK